MLFNEDIYVGEKDKTQRNGLASVDTETKSIFKIFSFTMREREREATVAHKSSRPTIT